MSRYQIENTVSGVILGIYEGATETEALDACARDAGYADYAAVPMQNPEDGEIVVTKIED
jgi:hypothetical protein